MSTQTYQVSASASRPASVSPPFLAHGVTATNNAGVNVTVSDDQGGAFLLTPGQTKTAGYRGSPGRWTVTATKDGPGSVALSFTDQFTPGDATPQNVGQSAGGNTLQLYGPRFGYADVTTYTGPWDTSGGQEAIVVLSYFGAAGGEVIQPILDRGLPSEYDSLPATVLPASAYLPMLCRFGRDSPWPLGTSLSIEIIPIHGSGWGASVYLNVFGG